MNKKQFNQHKIFNRRLRFFMGISRPALSILFIATFIGFTFLSTATLQNSGNLNSQANPKSSGDKSQQDNRQRKESRRETCTEEMIIKATGRDDQKIFQAGGIIIRGGGGGLIRDNSLAIESKAENEPARPFGHWTSSAKPYMLKHKSDNLFVESIAVCRDDGSTDRPYLFIANCMDGKCTAKIHYSDGTNEAKLEIKSSTFTIEDKDRIRRRFFDQWEEEGSYILKRNGIKGTYIEVDSSEDSFTKKIDGVFIMHILFGKKEKK